MTNVNESVSVIVNYFHQQNKLDQLLDTAVQLGKVDVLEYADSMGLITSEHVSAPAEIKQALARMKQAQKEGTNV